jgi:hypothetical protein
VPLLELPQEIVCSQGQKLLTVAGRSLKRYRFEIVADSVYFSVFVDVEVEALFGDIVPM